MSVISFVGESERISMSMLVSNFIRLGKKGRISRLDQIECDFEKTHLFTFRQGYLCSPISKAPSCAVIHVHSLSPI